MNNRIIIDNMNRQCIYNNINSTACPEWLVTTLWVVAGVVVIGAIAAVVWMIKESRK